MRLWKVGCVVVLFSVVHQISVVADDAPRLRALIIAGNKAHAWHNWKKTTPLVKGALEQGGRVRALVSTDIEVLASLRFDEMGVFVGGEKNSSPLAAASRQRRPAAIPSEGKRGEKRDAASLSRGERGEIPLDCVVLNNYANWHDPSGLSDAAKANLVRFLKEGGGLVVIHFANGAFHYSLPEAGASDWPEYRNIVRRVWNHDPSPPAPLPSEGERAEKVDATPLPRGERGESDVAPHRGGQSRFAPKTTQDRDSPRASSGHDAFGRFWVRRTDVDHPIVRGINAFEVRDELYFRQHGDAPIEPLLVARSKVTGNDEPMAFAYNYGKGRVFQFLLGHNTATYEVPEVREILRRAVVWAGGAPSSSAPLPSEGEKGERGERSPLQQGDNGKSVAAAQQEDIGEIWKESDSIDARWNKTDIGRFLASVVPLPKGPVRKGLSIRVGDENEATVCYDTEAMALRGAWTGAFVKFDSARFGIIRAPSVDGKLLFSTAELTGWQGHKMRYQGMHVSGDRVALQYDVDGCSVLESPWVEQVGNQSVVTRTLRLAPHELPITLNVLRHSGRIRAVQHTQGELTRFELDDAGATTIVALRGMDDIFQLSTEDGRVSVTLLPSTNVQRVQLVYAVASNDSVVPWTKQIASLGPQSDVAAIKQPGPPQWTEEIITRGVRGADDAPYVIDKLTLPFDNPYNALLFVGGHGFFSKNYAVADVAICTIHGDVWTVRGADDDLQRLKWRRFATGLHQPLGMVVIDDKVHVLGRNQITRLHDRNNDGEADYYENYCSDYLTSSGGHDFVAGLERDDAGNLYFIHAVTGMMKVSPGGTSCRSIATGFRNPNGMGASPSGIVTAAPQEGNWTPSSCIALISDGEYYGFGGPRLAPDRPLGYVKPMCYIPRLQDNSSGSQAWVTSDRWGPLTGQMLHFSYGQCTMMLTMREQVDDTWQGGNVDFPLFFDSGAMRGRFSPRDGQLYVSGLRGWQNRATNDGCLARVRYTGQPVHMPRSVQTMQNGLAITFTDPLDRTAAQRVGNYSVQRWNYRWRSGYGSPEYRVSDSNQEGRDDVSIRSATLLEDGCSVFLRIADMRPADQYLVRYAIAAADGTAISHQFSYTIHKVGRQRMDQSKLRGPARDGLSQELISRLQPGMVHRFEQQTARGLLTDARPIRMAAWYSPEGKPPTPRLAPGPFRSSMEGFIHVRRPGEYRFALDSTGNASLAIDGADVKLNETPDGWSKPTRLASGYVPIIFGYESPRSEAARFRLLWQSEHFGPEPIPPSLLRHDPHNEPLAMANQHYTGRELIARNGCINCHALPTQTGALTRVDLGLALHAPRLVDADSRLQRDWLVAWLLQPRDMHSHATMPGLSARKSASQRRHDAADLAAYLLQSAGDAHHRPPSPATSTDLAELGERLYEQYACMACHRFTAPNDSDAYDRISLHFSAAKFRHGAIARYVSAADDGRQERHTAEFYLDDGDSAAIEAYIRSELQGVAVNATDLRGDTERGRVLFQSHRCGACHAEKANQAESLAKIPLTRATPLNAGCFSESPIGRGAAPRFRWTTQQREAIANVLTSATQSLAQSSSIESSRRLVRQLRCKACHDRDGAFAPRSELIAEEGVSGQPPEMLPNLTWTGEKLRSVWIEGFLSGQIASPRPWLDSRMPHHRAHAAAIAIGLAAEHGIAPHADFDASATDGALAQVGEQLTLQSTLDCRQCHGIGSITPRGDDRTLNAPGINFVHINDRVRQDYFLRLLRNPQRVDPRSKMPKLSENGRTQVTKFLEGDAERQFKALWHYVQSLNELQR